MPRLREPARSPAVARPFLKWAGGKTQLLPQLSELLPAVVTSARVKTYFEPFLGGGALLFEILHRDLAESCAISDLNADLVGCYRSLQLDLPEVMDQLRRMANQFQRCSTEQRAAMFYEIRTTFNQARSNGAADPHRTAQLIFLNKTCFNGLYRVNRRGDFNTPVGAWQDRTPRILDESNLQAVSQALAGMRIELQPYSWVLEVARSGDFVYLDPPYRPLSATANFKSYTAGKFGDTEQRALAGMFRKLSDRGVWVMLSNSDPQAVDPKDRFFEDLYGDFHIHRVSAARMVNSKAQGRGRISELVVTNY